MSDILSAFNEIASSSMAYFLTSLLETPLKLANFLLQTFFFSSSFINAICFILSNLGLFHVGRFLFYNHTAIGISIIFFFCLQIWTYGSPLLIMNLMQFGSFYVCLAASEGCFNVYKKFSTKKEGKSQKKTRNQTTKYQITSFIVLILVSLCVYYVVNFDITIYDTESVKSQLSYKSGMVEYQYKILSFENLLKGQILCTLGLLIASIFRKIQLLYCFIVILVSWATLCIRLKAAELTLQQPGLQALSLPYQIVFVGLLAFESVQGQIEKIKKNTTNSIKREAKVMACQTIFKASIFFVLFCMMKSMTAELPLLLLLASLCGVLAKKFN